MSKCLDYPDKKDNGVMFLLKKKKIGGIEKKNYIDSWNFVAKKYNLSAMNTYWEELTFALHCFLEKDMCKLHNLINI